MTTPCQSNIATARMLQTATAWPICNQMRHIRDSATTSRYIDVMKTTGEQGRGGSDQREAEVTLMTNIKLISTLAAAAAVMVASTADAQQARVKARGANGTVTAAARADGSAVVRGRGTVQNEDGSTTVVSGGARRTAEGGRAVRAGTATYNEETGAYSSQRGAAAETASGATANTSSTTSGSRGEGWTRSGSTSASGSQGSASSNTSLTRNADGTVSGSSETNITGNASGITYHATTSIDPQTGQPVRTYSCTDASGTAVTCPSR